jgi:hypothetical protein
MFDPYAQMNPWFSSVYGSAQPYGFTPQTPYPTQTGWGFGGGFTPQIPAQTWYGNPVGQFGAFGNPLLQQLAQQIPQLVQNAHQIAQQAPQLMHQLPQLIQQNPQLMQQAPQLQQVPQLLQQAAILAQQIPHVLQALCSTHPQGSTFGAGPLSGGGGFRPFAFGQTAFS